MADLLIDDAMEKIPQWYEGKYQKSPLIEGAYEATDFFPHLGKKGTWLYFTATLVRDAGGNVLGAVETLEDVTERKNAEEKILAQLDEKTVLLREIHHRVKNNLQIIISLVNLQMRQTTNPAVKQIMAETQNRVRAMSLVHEKLYLSETLSRIDFADYSRFLATQLFSFYGKDLGRVHLDFAMSKIMVDINTAIPLGLVMNELISNALKHAFPEGKGGTISISGGDEGELIKLVIGDNGIGMPAELDWKTTTSLGLRLVVSLVDQIDGTIEKGMGEGTMFIIIIPRKVKRGKTT
jgi:two-component sensor histidine kinase